MGCGEDDSAAGVLVCVEGQTAGGVELEEAGESLLYGRALVASFAKELWRKQALMQALTGGCCFPEPSPATWDLEALAAVAAQWSLASRHSFTHMDACTDSTTNRRCLRVCFDRSGFCRVPLSLCLCSGGGRGHGAEGGPAHHPQRLGRRHHQHHHTLPPIAPYFSSRVPAYPDAAVELS